jgi:5'-3' exonuclease
MNILNTKIKNRFNNPSLYKLNKIIVSLSNEYGEGEHKIFKYIRDNEEDNKDKNNVVYGLDADLIMLSINHLPICKNIFLFRETPAFIKSINIELEPNETYMLDIPKLAETITLDMNNGKELNTIQQKNRLYDYIFMCFFLGNDFMPHFPSINIRTDGIAKMMSAYSCTIGCDEKENLTNGKTIYWKNVKKLVKYLADKEEEYLKKETLVRNKRELYKLPNVTLEDKWKQFENKPTYSRDIEKYINVFHEGWQKRYYKSLFNLNIDDLRKQQICINFLEGLEWTMKYYTTGCPDWRWCYNYNYPPLLNDLLHYIPYFENEFIINKDPNPVNELVQLCYVLPKQSLNLLPKKLHDNLLEEHMDWYSTDCEFIWAYCKYFWESHVDLPHIDISELELFVKINKA